jgi:tetratricopeptide (TPR) repeat protein
MSRAGAAWQQHAWQRPAVLIALPVLLAVCAALLPEQAAAAKVTLAAVVLLVYPGWLVATALGAGVPFGRTQLATAFGLTLGLWLTSSSVLQWLGVDLTTAGLVQAGLLLLLATVAGVRLKAWPVLSITEKRPGEWLEIAFFWLTVTCVLLVFAQHASIWRPTDRWTYAGIVRSLLDSNSLQPALAPGVPLNPRLDLSPWLIQIALLVRLSGVELPALYSYYLPPLLLVLALCAAFGLAHTVLGLRWASTLAVALLAVAWLADAGVPALAEFPWQERMLLRIEGGEASVGQWALLGRIVEDKFLLLYVLLPVACLWMWRYLLHGRRSNLLVLTVLVAALAVLHPLGLVYYGFGLVGAAFLRAVGRPARPVLVRALILGLLAAAGAAVPALQSLQLAAANAAAGVQPLAGQDFIDAAIDYGLWAAPSSETIYAAHGGLILRRNWLVAALLLLSLMGVRGWRRPAWQFTAGTLGAILIVAFNPLTAPWLAAIISRVFVPRMAWPLLLPGVMALALAVKWGMAWLRLRGSSRTAARHRMAAVGIVLLGFVLWQGPKLVLGFDLLRTIQTAALSPAEIEVLEFMRTRVNAPGTVLAEEWLTNELPAFVGNLEGIAFRGKDSRPNGYATLRDFYNDDRLQAGKLLVLAQYGIDYVVARVGGALDAQLGELAPAIVSVFANEDYRIYALNPGWEKAKIPALLLAAARAEASGRGPEVRAAAEAALRLAPANITARQALATALALEGNQAEALAAAQPLRDRWGDAPWVGGVFANIHRLQGQIAAQRGDGRAAAAAYRAAFAADPTDLAYGRELARLQAAAGGRLLDAAEQQAIVATFETAARPQPNDLSYLRRAALWALGEINELLDRPAAAEAAYRDALALTRPGDTEGEAIAQLGRFLVRQGRSDEAQALYAWALPRNSGAHPLYAAWAELAGQRGGPAGAQAVWRTAAAANPLAPWPYAESGRQAQREALDALH